ncbi:3-hydroxyisobutyrate dehydrogenase [Sansalvadorimonas sp. 2012CJ34-2]|uniref:3-hydroxyisobutyrate dehydrogenase n=1 Tax=Parendozoicomonas callyspongiae TaxID=2942213 RepID=A0ABT0PL27_9GAMM|nr:3-hydroxyisobutyrate dehydrogenase [Sansalvadorimonas sp. 2012CJ34-2]
MKIAFIGLGNMGYPMAVNLVNASFPVIGYDLSAIQVQNFTNEGGEVAETPADAVRDADAVISMLPNGDIVRNLYSGADGLFAKVKPGTLIVDSSTIDMQTARDMATEAQERELMFIDAPVSGGTAGAAAGTLTFMVGGTTDALERARPVLDVMGLNIFHAGDAGNGQLAKMCNNMLLAVHMAGTAEALALGAANGLKPEVLSKIMKQSSGDNWSLQKYNPVPGVMDGVPASNNYEGGFMVNLMLKDLGLALEAATASQQTTPLGALARNLFALHAGSGQGGKDFSSIYKMFDNS